MNWNAIIGFVTIALVAGLIVLFSWMFRKTKPHWREIPVIQALKKQVGLAVEDGSRLHLSIGRSDLLTPESMAAVSALSSFQKIARNTLQGDEPPVISAGDSTLAVLAQDTLKSASVPEFENPEIFILQGRLSGLTPFSYAAGLMDEITHPNVSSNVFIGHYGAEIGLLTARAEHNGQFIMAASDDLASQAVAYASVPDPLIGEELYALSAYVGDTPVHNASLRVQDLLRWFIVLALLTGAILYLVGIL